MKKNKLLIVTTLSAAMFTLTPTAHAKNGTFVHLFEWQWNDIATECVEFLGPKGFSAVQVSPPQEHIQGSTWWTRYQPVQHKLATSRSGTADEFKNMVSTCKAAGVDIYVDAVINHTSGGSGVGSSGSQYNANSLSFPQYSASDFHQPQCEIAQTDYSNDIWRVRNCNLPGLPDLDTSSSYTRSVLSGYLNELTDMGVAGFRLDAAKHMETYDIEAILSNVSGNPYIFQEVIDNGGELISANAYTSTGQVTEFKYSGGVSNRFLYGGIADLLQMDSWGLLNTNDAVVFTDNHDNQRGHGGAGDTVTYKNGATYDIANVFMLAFPYGYPKVMSSFAFDNTDAGPPSSPVHNNGNLNCFASEWQCEHRHTAIANMVGFRNFTEANAYVTDVWQDGQDRIAFGRGNLGFVVINRTSESINRTFNTSLPAGEYCNVTVSEDCSDTINVNDGGQAFINVDPWSSAAIHGGAMANGNQKPTPVIVDLPNQVDVGSSISLDGSASFDSDGSIATYSWSNGSNQAMTSVTLNTEGEACFTLTVTDNLNATKSATVCTWVGDALPVSNLGQINFRGTTNNWNATAMNLVADYTWESVVNFTGVGDASGAQRFKFDRFGDWTENYGDDGQNGSLELAGEEILFSGVGQYRITLNELLMSYSIVPMNENQAPVAVISPTNTTINVNEVINLSATQSTDTDGTVESFLWSTGEVNESISFSSAVVGNFTLTLDVYDNEGLTSNQQASVTINVVNDAQFVHTYPSMNLRGTFNAWAATAMQLIADNVWSIEVSFQGNSSPDRFKFDVNGDWTQNFGDDNADLSLEIAGDDILVATPDTYTITFNELDLTYSIKSETVTGFNKAFSSIFVRGTFNNWTCTEMTLIGDHQWSTQVSLDNQANQRLKFDLDCNWSTNYGDNNSDNVLDQAGNDIFVTGSGNVTIEVNDSTLLYQIQ